MNDKELLELAARAAGIEIISDAKEKGLWTKHKFFAWNPLTDDGDALRLAVKLGILADDGYSAIFCAAMDKSDPQAATRRAIVRAAAEIGRGMG